MSTQAIGASVCGNAGNHFLLTATDLTWNNDLVDANGLNIGATLAGKQITGAVSFYNAGCCAFRIYNPQTNQVKAMWFGEITTEQIYHEFGKTVTITKEDKIQAYPSAVTT